MRRPGILPLTGLCLLLIGGCANEVRIPLSQGHIAPPAPAMREIPAPVTAAPRLPPPKPAVKAPTYSVVVTEVPVKELLFALARDTGLNIDVHPNIQGIVTLNAINETLPAILDRIAQQVNIRWKLEGRTLIVTPDTPYLKTYRVDYVNIQRKTSSTIGVSAQVATTGSGTAVAQQSTGSNSSTTTVTSTSSNEFWEVLAANIRDILRSTRAQTLSAEERNARVEALRAAREERLQQASAVARAGQAAPTLFKEVFGQGAQAALEERKDDVIVNPVGGTVMVMATEAQHRLVQQYLDGVQAAANRQVLIEATIVEVVLKDEFSAGIDWQRALTAAAGTGFFFGTNANLVTSAPFFTLTYNNANRDFTAAVKLLESFGEARVLSSPKLMVLNNQTSMLKVVDNLVYFSLEVQQGTQTAGGIIVQPTFTTTAHTVPVGVVMAVTPQINPDGRVTLVVRPTITRKAGDAADPNPELKKVGVTNTVPVIQVREMESVLQVASGETVVLGGLMQDDSARNRDGLPGLTDNPVTNFLTGRRERKARQTELVVFLRPTVVTHPSLSSDELSFYRRWLPTPAPTSPSSP
ncbi:type II secretion system protein GspD [Thiobacter aerophilum]|uniref:Type II and III secretion system protein n=1 Tax=Thiobacter aerophilum TaxID=3121275 RepID=A0ABV0EH07_9BURK